MASRMGDARAEVARLRGEGWEVQETKDGWRLLHPNGVTTANLHKTPSDVHFLKHMRLQIARAVRAADVATASEPGPVAETPDAPQERTTHRPASAELPAVGFSATELFRRMPRPVASASDQREAYSWEDRCGVCRRPGASEHLNLWGTSEFHMAIMGAYGSNYYGSTLHYERLNKLYYGGDSPPMRGIPSGVMLISHPMCAEHYEKVVTSRWFAKNRCEGRAAVVADVAEPHLASPAADIYSTGRDFDGEWLSRGHLVPYVCTDESGDQVIRGPWTGIVQLLQALDSEGYVQAMQTSEQDAADYVEHLRETSKRLDIPVFPYSLPGVVTDGEFMDAVEVLRAGHVSGGE